MIEITISALVPAIKATILVLPSSLSFAITKNTFLPSLEILKDFYSNNFMLF